MGGIATAAIIGGGLSLLGSVFGGIGAGKRARAAAREKRRLTGELDILEKNRQKITNPYAGITNISSMAKDLSSMISNPYATLGVATQAAEIQIEQADIALANTLDTLRATGASAGGATALAQAALQSKRGVSASIEKQESANERLKAEGKANLEQVRMNEAGRIQNIGMGEAQRLQQAGVAGKTFMFDNIERRETEQLNRKQAQITGQAQAQIAARQDQAGYFGAGMNAVGNIGSAYMMSKGQQG